MKKAAANQSEIRLGATMWLLTQIMNARRIAIIGASKSELRYFSHLVHDLADYIDEIEINPLFVMKTGEGAVVGDALFTLNQTALNV